MVNRITEKYPQGSRDGINLSLLSAWAQQDGEELWIAYWQAYAPPHAVAWAIADTEEKAIAKLSRRCSESDAVLRAKHR
jgi:hypothetical protein